MSLRPENFQPLVRNLLLGFVLLSVGFALGKESQRRVPPAPSAAVSGGQTPVTVYYAHTTFRCVTCNTIEALAKQTLEKRFADDLAKGQIEWQVVNFQDDAVFAERYEIASSTVVVTRAGGRYQRLDEVWTKVDDPAAFEEYIAMAVQAFLRGPVE